MDVARAAFGLAVCALVTAAGPQLGQSSGELKTPAAGAGGVENTAARVKIVPLYGRVDEESLKLEDLNQCAGTAQRYRLPPTGYVPPPESSDSRAGKELYDRLKCASCHAIVGEGGLLGPPLDGIGGHRGKQFLEARLLDPAAQMRDFPDLFGGRPNIMPHPGVSSSDAAKLARYLLTLPEPAGGFLIISHPAISEPDNVPAEAKPGKPIVRDADVDRGRELFYTRGCAMCHHAEGLGGRFGPRLDGIAQRMDRQALERILRAEDKDARMKLMPPGLPPDQASSIVDFLLSLPPPNAPSPP